MHANLPFYQKKYYLSKLVEIIGIIYNKNE